jgi:hypothetical protein
MMAHAYAYRKLADPEPQAQVAQPQMAQPLPTDVPPAAPAPE